MRGYGDVHHKRGNPALGFLLALVVVGVVVLIGSRQLEDGTRPCGTVLSPIEYDDPLDFTQGPSGQTGCDRVVADRRMQLVIGGLIGLSVAVSASMSGYRGTGIYRGGAHGL